MKESSDESLIVESANSKQLSGARSATDYLAFAVGTCGVGLIPFAPGTWGSAVGVGVYVLLRLAAFRLFALISATHLGPPSIEILCGTLTLTAAILLTYAGVWAATRVEKLLQRTDPGMVVIDEVVGQLLTLLLIPISSGAWTLLFGFLAFRLFDIWKPYPVRRCEDLPAGLGIMADDIAAGLIAAALVSAAVIVFSFV